MLYLAHPTDGVGVWSFATLWRSPEWWIGRSASGSPRTRWFPIVSWVHETATSPQGSPPFPVRPDYRDQFVTRSAIAA